MKNNFTIVWAFRNRLEKFKESIMSAHNTCPKTIEFCLVDAASDDNVIRELRNFCNQIKDRVIRICESAYRSSLSEAWNLGMMLTDNRYVIFCSSDVKFFKSGWFELLRNETLNKKCEYVLLCNHTVFAFDKKAIPKMGWFDEAFVIGPHFDVDFMIRASEKDIKFSIVSNSDFYKNQGKQISYMERVKNTPKDYLPMSSFENEYTFNSKWLSNWEGWEKPFKAGRSDTPHPPKHISQVKRLKTEIDQHPSYSKKYKA